MKPSLDATVLDNVLFATRQPTPSVEGFQSALVVSCTDSMVTFRLPGFSSVAGYQAPLPAGWPTLSAGQSLLVAFVRDAFTGETDIWAVAYR